MNKFKSAAATAAFVLCAPLAANAVTVATPAGGEEIYVGQNYTHTGELNPGDTLVFEYVVMDALEIPAISIAATGTNGGSDLGNVRFDYFAVSGAAFSNIQATSTASAAFQFILSPEIPNPFATGDTFSFTFLDGIAERVGITVSYETVEPTSVPVPAGGVLMGAALLAFGAVRRRK